MRELNRFLGALSGMSGLGMITFSMFAQNLAAAFSGLSAVTIAVVLFQITDTRERITRIENLLITQGHATVRTKGKAAGQ